MIALLAGATWLAIVTWLLTRMLRQFRLHAACTLRPADSAPGARPVRVIVPARNEIANIGACLGSLAAQVGVGAGYRILVVDDASEDGTAGAARALAAADSRIALLPAGPLPPGWMGKPHACWRGALTASEDWLCFVDADARAAPRLIASAIRVAEQRGLDMLCLLPRHTLGSFWERLIIPTGLLMIACARSLRPAAGSDITVNGQFLLVRRAAYLGVGGHAAVRGALCEDKALAVRVREAGYRYAVMAAEPLLRVRLYAGLDSLWRGFARSGVEILGGRARTLAVAAAALLVGWAIPLGPLALAAAAWAGDGAAAWFGLGFGVAGSAIASAVLLGTARHFRVPPALALMFPIGTTMAAAIAWYGAMPGLRRRIAWKGRPCTTARAPRPQPR